MLTRPEPNAERTAAALRARGHSVTVAPLLRIEPVDAEIGRGPWAAILVTSANAAAAIARHKRFAELKSVPVLAVGERTAQAMRSAGFTEVISAAGAAGDLTRLAAGRLTQDVPLLYLAGMDRSGDIAGDLSTRNFTVCTAVVYRAIAADALPRAAAEALAGGVDGVLHFSRRSAEVFVNTARAAGMTKAALEKPAHFCLSVQVAEPLSQAGAAEIRIAVRPEEAALIELIPAA
jgi:uroporphyrinogen-III synthase